MESDAMPTAIASYLTLSGFVIAADGKVTDHKYQVTSLKAQKIFPITGHAMAYALYGYVEISSDDAEGPILDLQKEIADVLPSLLPNNLTDLVTVGNYLSEPLQARLAELNPEALRKEGVLDIPPFSMILYVYLMRVL